MSTDQDGINPITVPRPSQLVAAELRKRILRGEWRDGDAMPNAAVLAKRLGISRHHLREALRLLEYDGLVRIEHGPTGGVSLAVPDEEAVTRTIEGILARNGTTRADTHDARAVIDAAVAALAADRATAEDLAELEAMVRDEQVSGWRLCTEFHLGVTRAAHNQTMLVLVRATWPIGTLTGEPISDKLAATRKKPALGREAVQAHRDLLRALTARDSAGASAVMHRHHAEMFAHYEPVLRGLAVGASTGP